MQPSCSVAHMSKGTLYNHMHAHCWGACNMNIDYHFCTSEHHGVNNMPIEPCTCACTSSPCLGQGRTSLWQIDWTRNLSCKKTCRQNTWHHHYMHLNISNACSTCSSSNGHSMNMHAQGTEVQNTSKHSLPCWGQLMHTPDKVGPIVVMEEETGNNTETP